MIVNNSLY